MKKLFAYLLVLVAIILLAKGGIMRSANIERRAIHADEGEQTHTFAQLFINGEYKYNPHGPHGPILYYWPLMFLDDADKATFETKDLRRTLLPLYPASALLIFFSAFFLYGRKKESRHEALAAGAIAAAFFAFSSLSLIYTTYFVQEVFFAFFATLSAASFYFLQKKPSVRTALLFGLSLGLMQSAKETSVFIVASILGAFACIFFLKNKADKILFFDRFKKFGAKKIIFGALAFLGGAFAVYALFYSSFGKNPQGIADGITSYVNHFLEKSSGAEHAKGFFYYFKLLLGQTSERVFFGETYIFMAFLLSTFAVFYKRNEAGIFIAIYTWLNLLILSAIGYKTPWLLLAPMYSMLVVCGLGMMDLFAMTRDFWKRRLPKLCHPLSLAFFALAGALLYFQMGLGKRAAISYASDPRNPFIYVHTLKDYENLVRRITQMSAAAEGEMKMLIAMRYSPSPLLWDAYRRCDTAVIRDDKNIPELSPYSIVVYDTTFDKNFENKFDDKIWLEEYVGLRENILLRVFVKRALFEKSIRENL